MIIIASIVVFAMLWVHYEITDENGRWYDLFH